MVIFIKFNILSKTVNLTDVNLQKRVKNQNKNDRS